MTRGTMILVTDDGIFKTFAFNGGMNLEGHGKEVAKSMIEIQTKEEFLQYEEEFNKKYYGYPKEEIKLYPVTECDNIFDMSIDYYGRWFSDYLFFKNVRDETIEIKQKNGDHYDLRSGKTLILYFGNIAEDFIEIFEDEETLDNLREVRNAVAKMAGPIHFSSKDIHELATIMNDYNYKDICGVYEDRTEYAEDYASEYLENWMTRYFDFEKFGNDIEMSPEIGIVQLSSGIVVTLS